MSPGTLVQGVAREDAQAVAALFSLRAVGVEAPKAGLAVPLPPLPHQDAVGSNAPIAIADALDQPDIRRAVLHGLADAIIIRLIINRDRVGERARRKERRHEAG